MKSDDGSIIRKELVEGSSEEIFPGEIYTDNDYQGYSLSKTSEYVVYWKNYKKVCCFFFVIYFSFCFFSSHSKSCFKCL